MIWRSMFIDTGAGALAEGLAAAFGVSAARVAVVTTADGIWPDWVQGFEVVAETWPTRGEARLMATLFVFRSPAEVERLDDRALAQALADALGCAVFLADEADPCSDNYWRLRPGLPAERVALDPDGESENPTRVTVNGPATSVMPQPEDVSEAAGAAAK